MARVPAKPKKETLSVRFLLIMGGVIWGLVLGPDIGLAVTRFAGGLNWPFIAGTREWPEWADWVIVGSGVISGLIIFFTAMITGRNLGDRIEYSHDKRTRFGGAIPWAVIAVGVTLGGITVLTIEERQQAVIDYVQEQKDAVARLEEFATRIQRFRSVRVDWPGHGKEGQILISFRGKHRGNYLLAWEIWDSSNSKEPVIEDDISAALRPGQQKTSLPLSPPTLIEAWRKRGGNVTDATVSEDFIFRIRLIPKPTRAEWARLPRHEPGNLADGKSILIDEAVDNFPVKFEIRGGRTIWSLQ